MAIDPVIVGRGNPGRLARWFDSDVWHSFRNSPMAMAAAVIAALCIFGSLFAPWVTPHDPFDLATLSLSDPLSERRGANDRRGDGGTASSVPAGPADRG